MTVKEKLIEMCIERGLFQEQAQQIVESAVPEIEESGRITWNRPVDEYPEQIYATMFLYVREKALEWIDKNKPNAWCRPMFE